MSCKAAEEPKKAVDASALEQAVIKLESDNKDLKDRVLRALAEVENMRMRCENVSPPLHLLLVFKLQTSFDSNRPPPSLHPLLPHAARRSERNVADARAFGQQKFAESLLEVYGPACSANSVVRC